MSGLFNNIRQYFLGEASAQQSITVRSDNNHDIKSSMNCSTTQYLKATAITSPTTSSTPDAPMSKSHNVKERDRRNVHNRPLANSAAPTKHSPHEAPFPCFDQRHDHQASRHGNQQSIANNAPHASSQVSSMPCKRKREVEVETRHDTERGSKPLSSRKDAANNAMVFSNHQANGLLVSCRVSPRTLLPPLHALQSNAHEPASFIYHANCAT